MTDSLKDYLKVGLQLHCKRKIIKRGLATKHG